MQRALGNWQMCGSILCRRSPMADLSSLARRWGGGKGRVGRKAALRTASQKDRGDLDQSHSYKTQCLACVSSSSDLTRGTRYMRVHDASALCMIVKAPTGCPHEHSCHVPRLPKLLLFPLCRRLKERMSCYSESLLLVFFRMDGARNALC